MRTGDPVRNFSSPDVTILSPGFMPPDTVTNVSDTRSIATLRVSTRLFFATTYTRPSPVRTPNNAVAGICSRSPLSKAGSLILAVPICPERKFAREGSRNCTVKAPVASFARPSISEMVAETGPSPADSIMMSAVMPTRNFDASRSTMGTRKTKPSSASPKTSAGIPAAITCPGWTLRCKTTPLDGA